MNQGTIDNIEQLLEMMTEDLKSMKKGDNKSWFNSVAIDADCMRKHARRLTEMLDQALKEVETPKQGNRKDKS